MQKYMQTGYGAMRGNVEIMDVPNPTPWDYEIAVEVHAAALNPIDFKIIHGALKPVIKEKLPAPMGFDGSGIVIAIGDRVTQFKVGDAVFFRADIRNRSSFAQICCVDASLATLKPEVISHSHAASFPLVALTTVQGLVDRANAIAGQSILVHAGAGGVGSFAVQFAKAIGMEVTATVSSKNSEMVRELGADFVIERDKEDYRNRPARYDIVYDTIGGEATLDAFNVLKPGGAVVSIAGPPTLEMAQQLGLNWLMQQAMKFMSRKVFAEAKRTGTRYFGYFTQSDGAQLAQIAQRVVAGKIRAVIDKEYPFDHLVEALEYLETGRAKGKVVLKIK